MRAPLVCGCSSSAEIPASTMPSWSPDGRRIAFIQRLRGNRDLYVMNANGSHKRALTHDGAVEADPDWSPDGRRIVFTTGYDDATGINVINADGSGLALLDPDDAPSDPDWSPDGSRIVYASHDNPDGRGQLFVMDADGGNRHPLVVDDQDDIAPQVVPGRFPDRLHGWSRGRWLHRRRSRRRLGPKATHLQRKRLLAGVGAGRKDRLHQLEWRQHALVMNADGSNPHRLLGENSLSDWGAAWTSDGKRVAFVSDRDDTDQIYTANADGSRVRRLTGVRRAYTTNHDRCTIVGTDRDDRLTGTAYDDVICGLGGADVIVGEGGNDILDGGPGSDVLVGGPGYDELLGSAGNDQLDSRDGKRDEVDGGPGDDRGRIDPGDWIRLLERIL